MQNNRNIRSIRKRRSKRSARRAEENFSWSASIPSVSADNGSNQESSTPADFEECVEDVPDAVIWDLGEGLAPVEGARR